MSEEKPTKEEKRSLEDIEKDLEDINEDLTKIESEFEEETKDVETDTSFEKKAEEVANENKVDSEDSKDYDLGHDEDKNQMIIKVGNQEVAIPIKKPEDKDGEKEQEKQKKKSKPVEKKPVKKSTKQDNVGKSQSKSKSQNKEASFSEKIKIGITRFPGTNNEYETLKVLKSFGVTAEIINPFDVDNVDNYDGFWIAGGFSYADVLRAGAIASVSDLMNAIKSQSKPMLGVCNGFQILTEANVLPGSLIPNTSTRFICDWIHLKIPQNNSYLSDLSGKIVKLPIAHFEGNLFAYNDDVKNNIIAYYANYKGNVDEKYNPNGSFRNIAGLGTKSVVGLMPHPERASFKHQGSTDGRLIVEAFLKEVKQ